MKDLSYWDADHCALLKFSGKYCQTRVNKSPKVAPFCSVFHRHEYTREKNREFEGQLVATCACAGELVNNAGKVCRVIYTHTKEAEVRGPKNRRFKTGKFKTAFITACSEYPEYPKAIKEGIITCLTCIAVYNSSPSPWPWEHGYIDSLRKGP